MVVFCDAMILATLTLLGLVVAIFIIAISFLGRAIEQSSEQAARIIDEREEEFERTVQEADKKLKKAKVSGEELAEAKRTLENYEIKKKWFEKRRAKALAGYRLLTVKGGVLCPGGALLLSLAFVVIAKHLTTLSGTVALVFSYILMILAAVGVGWACYRAYRSLNVLQSVATIPEEVQLKRTIEAFETALQRRDERIRPKLDFYFTNPLPPFEFKRSSEQAIEFAVYAEEGSPAKGVNVEFVAPDGLEFPGVKEVYRAKHMKDYPGALKNVMTLGDLIGGYTVESELTIKLPAKVGTYKLLYGVGCEGFVSDWECEEVTVVE